MKSQTNIVLSLLLVLSALMIFCKDLTAQQVSRTQVTIPAGTPVEVRLEETASSETCTIGQTLKFTVTRDVSVDNMVVIKAGTGAIGEVAHAEASGSLGEEGVLSLRVRETRAVDGTRVPLRATLAEHGKEQKAASFLICPFIKGTKCVIEAGTETKAYVDYETKVTIQEAAPQQ